jgi:hypothetical protein
MVKKMCVTTQPNHPRTNFNRRTFGVIVAFLPLALLIASLASGIIKGQQPMFRGVGFMIGAAALASLNCYLSFVRPYWFRLRHGSLEGFRNVSGIPIIGTVLGFVGTVFGFGAIGSALIGIAAFVLDTGGSGWFVIATWRDRSLWDAR